MRDDQDLPAEAALDPTNPATSPQSPNDARSGLGAFTSARVALGRVGASLPTAEVLTMAMAHAYARDAVQAPFDTGALAIALEAAGFAASQVRSRAATRSEYLRRPDLGRRLHPDSKALLLPAEPAPTHRLTVIVGDGLSSLAPARHALPLLLELRAQLAAFSAWALDTVFLVTQARVALADEVGELRGAEAVLMLIGERPGLSSPDSLGAYMTYRPRSGRSDAERNCVSNVRPEGLSYAEAVYKLVYLLDQARQAGASGIGIKDSSDWVADQTALRAAPIGRLAKKAGGL